VAAHKPEFATYRYARHEWQEIEQAIVKATDESGYKDYYKKISAARKRGALAEADRLEAERTQLVQKLQAAACDQLVATATNPVVGVLVGLHIEQDRLNYTNRVERAALQRKIAANLGEVAYAGDKPDPAADAPGATMGMASQHGLMIESSWIQLNDASVGLPELAAWLCEHGCEGVKYDLSAGYGGTDEEAD